MDAFDGVVAAFFQEQVKPVPGSTISLVLERSGTDLAAQTVARQYPSDAANRRGKSPSAEPQAQADIMFWRDAPFDVRVGDRFTDGGSTGIITRVRVKPISGTIVAHGMFNIGAF